MNLGLLSLILLLAAIILGFTRNANVGILCIGFAMVLTLIFPGSVKAKDVLAGFSTSLFIQMAGVMYLFAIINANGTLELMAKKMRECGPGKAHPGRDVRDRHGAVCLRPGLHSLPRHYPCDRNSDLCLRRH